MKVALAQIQSVSGNIAENIKKHVCFIHKAIALKADIIVFPELSITNYEPTFAKELAVKKEDKRFAIFQNLSDVNDITICIGAPVKHKENCTISMLIFQPKKEVLNYAKQQLHKDEFPYFISGKKQIYINIKNKKIAFAICYESMFDSHFLNACTNNSDVYIASVAKSEEGVKNGIIHYQQMSEKHQKTILMVNAIGKSDDFISAGQSAAFKNGKLIQQLNTLEEEILFYKSN